jgi:hypothetical protein
MKYAVLMVFWLFCLCSVAQKQELAPRTVGFYLNESDSLEFTALLDQKILLDSTTLDPRYLDSTTGTCNMDGYLEIMKTRMAVLSEYYDGFLLMQKLKYKDDVLYFSLAGFDDMQWDIYRWKAASWNNEPKLTYEQIASDSSITRILWNYDEATKITKDIRIFIENDYLVMERGNLYHSLYDLKKEELILNENSTWGASDFAEDDELLEWIRINLHDKIDAILRTERN